MGFFFKYILNVSSAVFEAILFVWRPILAFVVDASGFTSNKTKQKAKKTCQNQSQEVFPFVLRKIIPE